MEIITKTCLANAKRGIFTTKLLCKPLNADVRGFCLVSCKTGNSQVTPQSRCMSIFQGKHKQKNDGKSPPAPEEGTGPTVHEENAPHFRESLPGRKTVIQRNTASSDPETAAIGSAPAAKADQPLHPDAVEALGMHEGGYRLPHPIWNSEELESVGITHRPPVTTSDKAAYHTVMTLRKGFDVFSGYTWGCYRGTLDERKWLRRIIFLETVAGVPGMVGAMVRHLFSLRKMKRDHGWIHTLIEEAENERMHLMTAMRVANPGIIMRGSIMLAQGAFVPAFSIAYLVSPKFCHRFVGYLEEEAVKTYTKCLEAIDGGELKMWCRMKAPEIAVEYWKLPEDAMMRDVILAIRADEAHHRAVNHTLSSKNGDEKNPYKPGE